MLIELENVAVDSEIQHGIDGNFLDDFHHIVEIFILYV